MTFISVDDDEEWHTWPPGGAHVSDGAQERPDRCSPTDASVSAIHVLGRCRQIVSHRFSLYVALVHKCTSGW